MATVISSGTSTVSSGKTLTNATIISQGRVHVTNSGTLLSATVSGGGQVHISSGGSDEGSFYTSGGWLYVSSGGLCRNPSVTNTEVYVSAGRVFSATVIGGTLDLKAPTSSTLAYVSHTRIFSGGTLRVDNNAVASDTFMAGGKINVLSGGKLQTTVLSSGGTNNGIYVSSGGTANGNKIYSGAKLYIKSGAYAQTNSIFAGGELRMEAGSAVYNYIDGGSCYIGDGLVSSSLIYAGGSMLLYGSASETRISSGGKLDVNTSAKATDTKVGSGGKANDTTVNDGGTLRISAVGIAAGVTVADGGKLVVSNGGTVTGAMAFAAGADVSVQEGGTVDFDISDLDPAGEAVLNDLSVVTGTPSYTITVSGMQEEGNYTLAAGAAGFSGTISVVNKAGAALGTLSLNEAATIGGVDYTLWLNSGSLTLTIGEGGGGSDFTGDLTFDEISITDGHSAYDVEINEEGILNIKDGGKASTVVVNTSGTLNVSAGGSASGVTVNPGGLLEIEIGGTANGTTVNLLGRMTVSSGGITDSTFLEGAPISSISLWEGGDPFSGGRLEIDSGGNATNIVAADGAILVISVVPDTYVQGTYAGSAFEIRDGLVNDFTVNDYCRLDIASGGTANRMTVKASFYHYGYEYARAYVSSGGTANSTSITGGSVFVSLGGIANDTTIIDEGGLGVECGGVANGITMIGSDTELEIDGGGTATNIVAPEGASLQLTVAPDTYIQGTYAGSAFEIKDGLVSDYTVHGWLRISCGGTASNITNESGYMTVSSGGKLTGRMMFESGARVSAYTGAVLDFDLSKTSAGAASLVNDLSIVQGTPNFTLTVDGSQANGTYKLATGAAAFDRAINVMNTSDVLLGMLTIGRTVTIDETDYTLNLDGDGLLSVTVGSAPGPGPGPEPTPGLQFLTGDFDNGGRALLAVEKVDTAGTVESCSVTIYSNGAEWGSGLALDPGWEVVGTGDFNADKKDDFLRVNTEGYVVGEMSQGDGTFAAQVLNLKNAGWSILGTGDFNGNGSGDVLIANPTAASETVGLLGYWESGVTWTLINGYSAEWEMVSCGDFNGDGKCDMLWKNEFIGAGDLTYNAYCTWIVEDPVDWRMVSVANPDEWNFLCSGDFDGNGSHDIAMINDVGVVGIWGVNDGYLNSWSILSAVTSEWTLAGVADFNGDGTDDIAWSNTDTGLTGYWQINDKTLTTWANLATLQAV